MNQYFFKMNQAEKNNILDQHKKIYDGYVTQYGQGSNEQPLYVQSYANDTEGLVVTNKGVVKTYTNMGINESHSMLDKIADGPTDLKNGTVDLDDEYPSPNDSEFDFISLGAVDDDECIDCEDEIPFDISEEGVPEFNYIKDDLLEFEGEIDPELMDEIPVDLQEGFTQKLNESLNMFKRIIK
jgi:hypothetical protein